MNICRIYQKESGRKLSLAFVTLKRRQVALILNKKKVKEDKMNKKSRLSASKNPRAFANFWSKHG